MVIVLVIDSGKMVVNLIVDATARFVERVLVMALHYVRRFPPAAFHSVFVRNAKRQHGGSVQRPQVMKRYVDTGGGHIPFEVPIYDVSMARFYWAVFAGFKERFVCFRPIYQRRYKVR